MPRKSLTWASVLTLACVIAYQQFRPTNDIVQQTLTTESQRVSTAGTSDTEIADSIKDVATAELDNFADPDTEMVMGIRVRKDRNCTVTLHHISNGDGTVSEAYACTPNEPAAESLYDQFDDATLASMSYADSIAANELGQRVIESDPIAARALFLRSVALAPENIDPLLWLASARYSIVARNGKPAIEALSNRYVLTRLADEFSTSNHSTPIHSLLVEAGLTDNDFQSLNERILQDLQSMRQFKLRWQVRLTSQALHRIGSLSSYPLIHPNDQ